MGTKFDVPSDLAVVIFRGAKNSGVLVVNQNNVSDVYVDHEPSLLNSVVATGTPAEGTKVAKNGGQVQFTAYTGVLYCRADGATGATDIRVVPS